MLSFLKSTLAPEAPMVVPPQLPKISAKTAAELAKPAGPGAAAQSALVPQQTPSQYLAALQEKNLGEDMVKMLAHGLPDREGVQWAALSANQVADKLPPADAEALKAAQAWVKSPTDAARATAAEAAGKTEMKTPGALAAQAAAWSQPAAGAPRLAPQAVAGAVLLAAGMSAPPAPAAAKKPEVLEEVKEAVASSAQPAGPVPTIPPKVQAQMFKTQQPFIEKGLEIASGKLPIA